MYVKLFKTNWIIRDFVIEDSFVLNFKRSSELHYYELNWMEWSASVNIQIKKKWSQSILSTTQYSVRFDKNYKCYYTWNEKKTITVATSGQAMEFSSIFDCVNIYRTTSRKWYNTNGMLFKWASQNKAIHFIATNSPLIVFYLVQNRFTMHWTLNLVLIDLIHMLFSHIQHYEITWQPICFSYMLWHTFLCIVA